MKELTLSKDEQHAAIESIKDYYRTEKDQEITDLSALLLLDFFLKNIGPFIYNQALKDAHYFLSEKMEDLFALEKPIQRRDTHLGRSKLS